MKKYFIDNLISQLNCISRISALENAPKAQKLTKQIINNIKYKTGRQGQIIKLNEEINAVQNLIEIFKFRFGDIIKASISIDKEYYDVYIPHYTLMTFVENSFYHAFENKEGCWEVRVESKDADSHLRIMISDNGSGFNPDEYVNSNSPAVEEYGTINSTRQVLNRYYKCENIVQIMSSNGQGTRVILNLPEK